MKPSVIYDLFYLNKNSIKFLDNKFSWPTKLNDYACESDCLIDNLIKELLKSKFKNHQLFLTFIFSEIISNAEKILRITLDYHYINKNSYNVNYDKVTQPIFYIIFSEKKIVSEERIFERLNSINSKSLIKGYLSKKIRFFFFYFNLIFRSKTNRIDIHSRNTLLNEYTSFKKINNVTLRGVLGLENINYKKESEENKSFEVFSDILKESLKKFLSSDIKINNSINIFNVLTKIAISRVSDSLYNLEKNNIQQIIGSYIIGGSPKPIGRILNYFYQKNKKKAFRFSHGGDRLFFKDKHWLFSELIYVNEYYCHSSYESIIQNKKFKLEKENYPMLSSLKFKSKGSKKHKKIWQMHNFKRKINKKRRILILAGSFLGEHQMGALRFKIPDIIALEFLLYLYKIINELNYEVFVKPHPKGICKNILKDKFKNIKLYNDDFLNPNKSNFDCFIFEFAGSAFYDSLLTNKGIILCDNNIRPWFKKSKKILSNRCQIIQTSQNQKNWLRVNKLEFKNKLNMACEYKITNTKFSKLLY